MWAALFAPLLTGALASAAVAMTIRVVAALGIGVVTYSGITTGLDALKASIISNIGGLSAQTLGFITFMHMDRALAMIFSAVTASLVIRGVTSSGLTKFIKKP